jgi:hypothetical protein
MDLRTTFKTDPSKYKINHSTPAMFIGSCFAAEIGAKMAEGKMDVLINPSGVVYNPVSVANTLDIILEKRVFTHDDLYLYNGICLSFSHYTDFSSDNPSVVLNKINSSTNKANQFLKRAGFLFITFGTSRVYRFKENAMVVSNCHKLPSSLFERELLSIEEIVSVWEVILDRIHSFNSNLKVIFTVSPVRHWKDGAHGNQISKSILLLAVERLLEHKAVKGYFPAYELLMDDLRDYRFYGEDMLHPSVVAVEYIWKAFSDCYFDGETLALWKELFGITKARKHRFISDSPPARKEFAGNILKKIEVLKKKYPNIDLRDETSYFLGISK